MFTVTHNGDMGDCIYSIPAALALAEGRQLHWGFRPSVASMGYFGGSRFTREAIAFLTPLFESQGWTCSTAPVTDPYDVDLSLFRRSPINLLYNTLQMQYSFVFQALCDYTLQWLWLTPTVNDFVIVGRSPRYTSLDYGCLAGVQGRRIGFLGLEGEWETFRAMCPGAEWLQVKDALEGARLIAGSRGYVGNSSFWYSVAEGLKVRRILEVNQKVANVVPMGGVCTGVVNQLAFQWAVERLF